MYPTSQFGFLQVGALQCPNPYASNLSEYQTSLDSGVPLFLTDIFQLGKIYFVHLLHAWCVFT